MELETLRLSIFVSILGVFYTLEYWIPLRPSQKKSYQHALLNLSLIFCAAASISIIKGLIPSFSWPVFGLFKHVTLNPVVQTFISVVLLDLALYWQHRLSHIIPLFWRFHQIHHSDELLETSTAVRFHPVVIAFSQIYQWSWVLLLGITFEDFILFQIILSAFPLMNHANIQMPLRWERVLNYAIVTPRFHEIHHSNCAHETNSNYGFFISVWDRLFHSHTPLDPIRKIRIGLDTWTQLDTKNFMMLLLKPFK